MMPDSELIAAPADKSPGAKAQQDYSRRLRDRDKGNASGSAEPAFGDCADVEAVGIEQNDIVPEQ